MKMNIIMNIPMIDIHNHLLPGVDDGSKDLETTVKLLKTFKEQGIEEIFLTPHVNSSVSKTKRSKHFEIFLELIPISKKIGVKINLGSEIYISFRLPEIDLSQCTLGDSNFLLVEFSTINEAPIIDHAFNLTKRGFKVIIAHVERYEYLTIQDLNELKSLGVFFQLNASSLINSQKKRKRDRIKYLLKTKNIDFIATDCHNTNSRPPNLKLAYKKLTSIVDEAYAKKLVFDNANKFLLNNKSLSV